MTKQRLCGIINKYRICECSSMVEFQPSKLVAWVRFPSLAPIKNERTLCPLVYYCVSGGAEKPASRMPSILGAAGRACAAYCRGESIPGKGRGPCVLSFLLRIWCVQKRFAICTGAHSRVLFKECIKIIFATEVHYFAYFTKRKTLL